MSEDSISKERAKRLGAAIRAIRRARGMTLEQVAQIVGTKHAPLSQIERGERRPGFDMLENIAVALGVSPSAFWDDHDPTAPDPEPPEEPATDIEARRTGELLTHEVTNTVSADGLVRGDLPFIGVVDHGTGLSHAMVMAKASRRANKHAVTKRVELAGVQKGRQLVEVLAPIPILVGGEFIDGLGAGTLLVVEVGAQPLEREVELVVAVHDPNPLAEPTEDDPDPGLGEARLMRYEPGPRGNHMLYDLRSDAALTTAAGWRIVGVVVDRRPPPRTAP